jgi:outer membrane protein assembly factor BamB
MLRFAIALGLSLFVSIAGAAESWPSWRGPTQKSVAAGKSYPTKWTGSDNVKWKIKLPGKGSSSPIVWEDRVVLTYGIEGQNAVGCFDRSGEQLWEKRLGKEVPGKNKKATGSNPSAVTDGEHVFVYFKSGDLAALDFDGKIVWQLNLQKKYGEDTLWWDLGTSPVLTKNFIVIAVMQTGPSYLVALDKASGEVAWKQDRNLDAPVEAAQAYSTPVVIQHEGQEQIVVLGADHVTCHAAANGKELWRVGGFNPKKEMYYRSISGPVVEDGIVIAPYARGATVTGIKLGGSGDVTKSHVAWTRDDLGADVPTPAAADGKAYVCTDKGVVVCIDVKTGKNVWSVETEKNRNAYSASPILAGGKVYVVREDAKSFVVDVAEKKVVAANEMEGEFAVATPAFVDGTIFLRTLDHLFLIGK